MNFKYKKKLKDEKVSWIDNSLLIGKQQQQQQKRKKYICSIINWQTTVGDLGNHNNILVIIIDLSIFICHSAPVNKFLMGMEYSSNVTNASEACY